MIYLFLLTFAAAYSINSYYSHSALHSAGLKEKKRHGIFKEVYYAHMVLLSFTIYYAIFGSGIGLITFPMHALLALLYIRVHIASRLSIFIDIQKFDKLYMDIIQNWNILYPTAPRNPPSK
jgi:hypothetical protein